MPNKRYRKGRQFEYRVRRILEAAGFYATRTPASGKTAGIDIIAIYNDVKLKEYLLKKLNEAHRLTENNVARQALREVINVLEGINLTKILFIECKTTSRYPAEQRVMQEQLAKRVGAKLILVNKKNIRNLPKILEEVKYSGTQMHLL